MIHTDRKLMIHVVTEEAPASGVDPQTVLQHGDGPGDVQGELLGTCTVAQEDVVAVYPGHHEGKLHENTETLTLILIIFVSNTYPNNTKK